MNALRAAWKARSPRERTVMGFGAAILSVALLYAFVWEPARGAQKRLREYLPNCVSRLRSLL